MDVSVEETIAAREKTKSLEETEMAVVCDSIETASESNTIDSNTVPTSGTVETTVSRASWSDERNAKATNEKPITSLMLLAEAYDSSDCEGSDIEAEENKDHRDAAGEMRTEDKEPCNGGKEDKEAGNGKEDKEACNGKEDKEACNSKEDKEASDDKEDKIARNSEGEEGHCTDEIEIIASAVTAQRREVIVLSSDSDSDSDSDSLNDDSVSSKAESDDDQGTNRESQKNGHVGRRAREKEMKGEFDDLPPIEELKISVPEVLCDPLGEVGWMVEQMVVVKPKPGKPTLNLDTILFVERGRRVLGRIFDVFGQVSEPHYCVRFNNSEHIEKSEIKVGMVVYFCPNTEYTSVVFLNDLLKMKATEEVGDDEHPEFSDDEEERAYYAALRQKQKNEKAKNPEVPQKRQRTDGPEPGWRSNHPWSTVQTHHAARGARPNNVNNRAGGDWSGNQEQRSPYANPNFRQYGTNERWPMGSNPYTDNRWRNPNQAPMPRPFFRPMQPYGPYAQNTRFPIPNFSWQVQNPSPSAFPWLLPPPPPPPPGI